MTIRRQDIIDAMKTRLATITVANGYETGIGSKVLEWRGRTLDGGYIPVGTGEMPCVIIRDTNDILTRADLGGSTDHSTSIELEIRCEEAANTPAFLRKAITDIYNCVGVDETWSAIAKKTDRLGDEIVVGQSDKTIGAALVKLQVIYSTTGWSET